jgi:hypothetical protein
MKLHYCLLSIALAIAACTPCVVRADKAQTQTPLPQDRGAVERLRAEYRSARGAYEELLKANPEAETAKVAAEQAEKGHRETVLRENAETHKELAALRTRMDGCAKAYLATNAEYAKLQSALNNVGKGSWTLTNWMRLQELHQQVAKWQAQTGLPPQEEVKLRAAREELQPLVERYRAIREEKERLTGKLSTVQHDATQTPEHKELARQYMTRLLQMWDHNSKNEKLRFARQAMLEKKKLFTDQLAQTPELLRAKERRDEAWRACGKVTFFDRAQADRR